MTDSITMPQYFRWGRLKTLQSRPTYQCTHDKSNQIKIKITEPEKRKEFVPFEVVRFLKKIVL